MAALVKSARSILQLDPAESGDLRAEIDLCTLRVSRFATFTRLIEQTQHAHEPRSSLCVDSSRLFGLSALAKEARRKILPDPLPESAVELTSWEIASLGEFSTALAVAARPSLLHQIGSPAKATATAGRHPPRFRVRSFVRAIERVLSILLFTHRPSWVQIARG